MFTGKRALVFDLDGTLIDSAPDIRYALNLLLMEEGRRSVGEEEGNSFIGKGILNLIKQAFIATGTPIKPQDEDAMYDRYKVLYLGNMTHETEIYPGVLDCLTKWRAEGWLMAICTNKAIGMTKPLLRDLGLDHFFSVVIGGDSAARRKPWSDPLDETLRLLEVGNEQALMIGDSINDIDCAKYADVQSILVTYGYRTQKAESLGADAMVDHFAEIDNLI
jgi:phosphoglycolate phosphatase